MGAKKQLVIYTITGKRTVYDLTEWTWSIIADTNVVHLRHQNDSSVMIPLSAIQRMEF